MSDLILRNIDIERGKTILISTSNAKFVDRTLRKGRLNRKKRV
jgi:hypothetical protein